MRSGRYIRLSARVLKSEILNPKHETNPKSQFSNVQNKTNPKDLSKVSDIWILKI
jgi:hypothetical protein